MDTEELASHSQAIHGLSETRLRAVFKKCMTDGALVEAILAEEILVHEDGNGTSSDGEKDADAKTNGAAPLAPKSGNTVEPTAGKKKSAPEVRGVRQSRAGDRFAWAP